jgi:hypothetical protein
VGCACGLRTRAMAECGGQRRVKEAAAVSRLRHTLGEAGLHRGHSQKIREGTARVESSRAGVGEGAGRWRASQLVKAARATSSIGRAVEGRGWSRGVQRRWDVCNRDAGDFGLGSADGRAGAGRGGALGGRVWRWRGPVEVEVDGEDEARSSAAGSGGLDKGWQRPAMGRGRGGVLGER